MSAYLLDHPPARSQFRTRRRELESGVVVIHTAENAPDTVATDGGAEAVAGFIQRRSDPGSYHMLVDSDSTLRMVPWDFEAFQDGTGSNPHAVGLSVATTAAWWPWAPRAWRDGAIEQLARAAADYAHWLYQRRGIVIPARRINRAESELRTPGFISHGERDPGRRTDPGQAFPWAQFLARYAQLVNQEDDMTPEQAKKLDAVELRSIATLQRLEELAKDVPPNLADEIDELRRNVRAIAAKVGVAPADIES